MKKYIEALLFASSEPLSQSQVNSIFPNEKVNLKEIVLDLNKDYQESNKLIYIKPLQRDTRYLLNLNVIYIYKECLISLKECNYQ